MYRSERWTAQKAYGEKIDSFKYDIGGELYRYLDDQKDEQMGPRVLLEAKNDKTKAVLLQAHIRKAEILGSGEQ